MIFGYFLVEWIVLPVWGVPTWGLVGASGEFPLNIGQILVGGLVGIPIAYVLRRRMPQVLKLN